MHPAIIRRRSTVATLATLKGDAETDHPARVTCREEMPFFAGFSQEEQEELNAFDSFDTLAYASEATAYRRGMTCELVDSLED